MELRTRFVQVPAGDIRTHEVENPDQITQEQILSCPNLWGEGGSVERAKKDTHHWKKCPGCRVEVMVNKPRGTIDIDITNSVCKLD